MVKVFGLSLVMRFIGAIGLTGPLPVSIFTSALFKYEFTSALFKYESLQVFFPPVNGENMREDRGEQGVCDFHFMFHKMML